MENYDGEQNEDIVVKNCRNLPYYTVEVYWALRESEKDRSTFDRIIGDLILQSSKLLKGVQADERDELKIYKSRLLFNRTV